MASPVITILAIIMALGATVCAFIFVVPEKKRAKNNKFMQLLHDLVNFKFLILEKVLQALYILSTALCIFYGFFMLFWVETYNGYYYSSSRWMGGYGVLIMLLGPIAVRLVYEAILMFIIAVKNIIQINSKLKNQNGDNAAVDMFSIPAVEKKAEPAPVSAPVLASFCTQCGTRCNEDGICPNCGK